MGRVESFSELEWSLMIEIDKFGRIKEEMRNYRESGIAGEIQALSQTQVVSFLLYMPLHASTLHTFIALTYAHEPRCHKTRTRTTISPHKASASDKRFYRLV